jgi:hypothetical protein
MKRFVFSLFGYTVVGVGFHKRHHCLTRSEALEWLACYPHALLMRRGVVVAERKTQ